MMHFKIGDKAVYPAHGVAEVTGVEAREVAGSRVDCYVLNILSSGATVMVPVASCERAGMRGLMNKGEIDKIFDIFKSPARSNQRAWNKRCREFNEKLRSGSVYHVAEVLRDLWTQQESRGLSFGEKQMLEKCRDLVISEISFARNVSASQIESEISEVLTPHY